MTTMPTTIDIITWLLSGLIGGFVAAAIAWIVTDYSSPESVWTRDMNKLADKRVALWIAETRKGKFRQINRKDCK